MGFLATLVKNLHALVGPGLMLVYPLYASVRAIESPSPVDDQQWLTYWIIYSFITLFELTFWNVLQWFPLWPYMKLLFCCWLVLPIFNGAAYIYENHVRKYVKIGSYVDSSYTERQRRVMQMMSLDARKAVERYIDTYGPKLSKEYFKRLKGQQGLEPNYKFLRVLLTKFDVVVWGAF